MVYGHLRTADAVSPVTTGAVATSLATFVVVYAFVFGFGTYYLAKLLRRGPEPVEEHPRATTCGKKPKRPLSLPDEGSRASPATGPSRPSRRTSACSASARNTRASPSGCR